MRYLSIDTETTGLDKDRHQILEIGAIVEDTLNILPYEELPKINIILHYPEVIGTPYALHLNSRLFGILKEYEKVKNSAQKSIEFQREIGSKVVPYNEAPNYLYSFLEKHYISKERAIQNEAKEETTNKWVPIKVTAAGKNVAGFDIPFLKRLPRINEMIQFHSRCIDPANYMVKPEDKVMPGSDICKKRAGLSGPVSHEALADAWDMIQILRFGAKGLLYP